MQGGGGQAYLLIPGGHGALHVLVAGEEGHDAIRDHSRHLQQEVPVVPDHSCEESEVRPSPVSGPPPFSVFKLGVSGNRTEAGCQAIHTHPLPSSSQVCLRSLLATS